jgi:hypothetical protein
MPMRLNQSYDDSFDHLLKTGLQNHTIVVPPDFVQNLLTRVQRQEYVAALAAIKMRERMLLAIMILLPIAAAAVTVFLPHQIVMLFNVLLADARQSFLLYAANIDIAFWHWIKIMVVVAILICCLFVLALEYLPSARSVRVCRKAR